MKKIIKIFLFLIVYTMLLLITNKTYAASANISATKTNIKVGESTTINVSVKDTEVWDLKLSCSGGSLSKTAEADSAGSQVSRTVMSSIFKANSAGTYTVSLFGKVAGSDLKKKNVEKSVTITVTNSSSSNSGSSTSSSSGSNSSNSSSKAALAMISTSPVDFSGFKSDKTGPYYVTVENSVTQLGVSARGKNGSTYSVSGNKNLQEGTNKVVVTAKNGKDTKNYIIYVTRKTASGEVIPNEIDDEEKEEEQKVLRLDNIVLDDTLNVKLDPNFSSEVFEYTVLLGNDYLDLEELYINAIPNIEGAKVTIEGNKEFIDGENIVTIKIEAEDYETVTYTIKVIRGEIVETEAEPVLEQEEEIPDNSEEIKKKRIIISVLVLLILLIGIIFIIKERIESKKNKYEEDYQDEDFGYNNYNEEQIEDNYTEKDEEPEEKQNNILEDIYNKNNVNSILETQENNYESGNKEENNMQESKASIDDFFNSTKRIEFEGEKTRRNRRNGKGKHS